jgi:hypothetical protein
LISSSNVVSPRFRAVSPMRGSSPCWRGSGGRSGSQTGTRTGRARGGRIRQRPGASSHSRQEPHTNRRTTLAYRPRRRKARDPRHPPCRGRRPLRGAVRAVCPTIGQEGGLRLGGFRERGVPPLRKLLPDQPSGVGMPVATRDASDVGDADGGGPADMIAGGRRAMRLPRKLESREVSSVCTVCGGDHRHLCRRCRERAAAGRR